MAATNKTMVGDVSKEVLAFTAGNDAVLDLDLVEVDCVGSMAHATMLAGLDVPRAVLSTRELKRLRTELVRIMKQSRDGDFSISAADQDVHLAVERVLTERLGDTGRRIHTARSRNDQVAVDLRLYGKEQLLDILDGMFALIDALLKMARRHRMVPMVGRTHLQPGMPSSVGVWTSAYAEALLDDIGILVSAYELNDRCPLGSAAGYGVPLPIDRMQTSKLLGFHGPIHNVMYASSARGKCELVILNALSNIMLTLSRFAEDLILFSMPEFGYFTLPKEFCTGSSIMPQKNNPDVLELIRARAGTVIGYAHAATLILKGLPGGYNRDLQEIKEPFLSGLRVSRGCISVLVPLVSRIGVNRKALAAGFTPDVFAADRALDLVAEGMPFRDAYNYVRSHLDELKDIDPLEAIGRKVHLGAPAGLDLGVLRDRMKEGKKFARGERTRYYSSISKLMGVKYPALA